MLIFEFCGGYLLIYLKLNCKYKTCTELITTLYNIKINNFFSLREKYKKKIIYTTFWSTRDLAMFGWLLLIFYIS